MRVPFWVIRNILYPYGARQPELTMRAEKREFYGRMDERCPECTLPMSGVKYFIGARWICRWCHDKKAATTTTPIGITSANSKPFVHVGRPRSHALLEVKEEEGNLGKEEYRFWIGVRYPFGTFAICRGCRATTNSFYERVLHKNAHSPGRDPCTTTLVFAYKELLKKGNCIVCKGFTKKSKWGIPLCCIACQEQWKFGTSRYLQLEMALRQVRGPQLSPTSGSNDTGSMSNPAL